MTLPVLACALALALVFVFVPAPSAGASPSACLSGATPVVLATSCAPGFYCPHYNASDPATHPVYCPATNACTMTRLNTGECDEPQGIYEPKLCKEGYYCPSATEQLACPDGHICLRGQSEPTPCGATQICAPTKRFDLGAVITLILGDVGLFVLWLGARAYRRKKQAERNGAYQHLQTEPVAAVTPADSKLPAHTQMLCQGFRRAQLGLPVVRLQFEELSLSIPRRGTDALTILKGVNGSLEPGKVTAVMGPSGAGKTTFLNVMLGAVDSSWLRGGSLRINSVDEPLGRYRKIVGYVPQEDIMHRDLSVYDNILYSANVRLPASWTSQQREDHVNATIAAMQLKHVQDTRIGDEVKRGISGGQRKRCNIGMELASAPQLLLLDEPTSGLDSTAAMEICQVLTDLARVAGITVCMVVHQPRMEIWNQLDELLLLAPGGLTVFQGPQRVAVAYFAHRFRVTIAPHENPADALMDLIAARADEFVGAWKHDGAAVVEQLRLVQAARHSSPPPPPSLLDDDHSAHSYQAIAVDANACDRSVQVRVQSPRNSSVGQKARGANLSYLSNPPPFECGVALRVAPGFWRQVWLVCVRNLWKQMANLPSLVLEVALGCVAGGIMGSMFWVTYRGFLLPPYTLLSSAPLDSLVPTLVSTVGLAISLAAVSAGVAVFGEEQVIAGREVAAGHDHLAYYVGTNLAQFPRLFIDGLHFAFIFHVLNQPYTPFGHFLAFAFLMYCALYGMAAIVSMLVSRKNAALLSVVAAIFFSNMVSKGGLPEFLQVLSASRWAAEGLFVVETEPYRAVMDVADTADRKGFSLTRGFAVDMLLMFAVGIFYRALAYAAMRFKDRRIIVR